MFNQKGRTHFIGNIIAPKPIFLRLRDDSVKTFFAAEMAHWKWKVEVDEETRISRLYIGGYMYFSSQN